MYMLRLDLMAFTLFHMISFNFSYPIFENLVSFPKYALLSEEQNKTKRFSFKFFREEEFPIFISMNLKNKITNNLHHTIILRAKSCHFFQSFEN